MLVAHHGRPQTVGAVGNQGCGKGIGEIEPAGVDGHPDLGVGAETVEGGHLVGGGDAARDGDPGARCGLDDPSRSLEIDPAEAAFALDEGDEKAADQLVQLGQPVEHRGAGSFGPAPHHHLAVDAVEGRDHPVARQLGESTSGVAAVPRMTLRAPASSHSRACSTVRMPPPTRHG